MEASALPRQDLELAVEPEGGCRSNRVPLTKFISAFGFLKSDFFSQTPFSNSFLSSVSCPRAPLHHT